jgi:REP element-mobilizing transposase RayT
MARKLRVEYPGALYHVTSRGNYRRPVFGSVGAARAFVAALEEACERFSWRAHAYAIIWNHFHLALETPVPNLGDGMHWLLSTFATRFNRFRDERRHLFQGRYQAPLIQDTAALSRVVSYIHLNPVRAKLVAADQIGAFRWSSLLGFVKGPRPAWLVPEGAPDHLRFPDTARGWTDYTDYLRALAANPAEQERLGFDEFCTGRPIGTLGWRRAIARELSHRALEAGFERQEILDIKMTRWRDELERGLLELGKTAVELMADGPSAPWKLELACRLRSAVAAPHRWICEQLCMASPIAVRMHVYRVNKTAHRAGG